MICTEKSPLILNSRFEGCAGFSLSRSNIKVTMLVHSTCNLVTLVFVWNPLSTCPNYSFICLSSLVKYYLLLPPGAHPPYPFFHGSHRVPGESCCMPHHFSLWDNRYSAAQKTHPQMPSSLEWLAQVWKNLHPQLPISVYMCANVSVGYVYVSDMYVGSWYSKQSSSCKWILIVLSYHHHLREVLLCRNFYSKFCIKKLYGYSSSVYVTNTDWVLHNTNQLSLAFTFNYGLLYRAVATTWKLIQVWVWLSHIPN